MSVVRVSAPCQRGMCTPLGEWCGECGDVVIGCLVSGWAACLAACMLDSDRSVSRVSKVAAAGAKLGALENLSWRWPASQCNMVAPDDSRMSLHPQTGDLQQAAQHSHPPLECMSHSQRIIHYIALCCTRVRQHACQPFCTELYTLLVSTPVGSRKHAAVAA
jgi:hypothetical protein